MNEIWKSIISYEGYYEVSNLGNVRNHYLKHLTQQLSFDGYFKVGLFLSGKRKKFSIHRLVALTFITNPENKATVNHKDGNKLNNNVLNLEWATRSENTLHAYKHNLINKDNFKREGNYNSNSKSVLMYNKLGELINVYNTLTEAAKDNKLDVSDICKVCKGKKKSTGGYILKYNTENKGANHSKIKANNVQQP